MDGTSALYALRQLLEEDSSSGFLDTYTSYQFLNEAAVDFARATRCLKATQSITTVASTSTYDINRDFMGLYMRNKSKKYVLQYNDGSNNHFITWKPYEDVILADQSSETATVPTNFTFIDENAVATQLSSTTTAAGAATGGKSTLTDTAADFSDVEAGDSVHNTTDSSDGVVVSKTSSTVLKTALFNGTDNEWGSGDSYVIQPQGRMQLVFNPPPSTASHTATLYYLQRPAPVYTSYDTFRFPSDFMPALIKYAAWLYKYRDSEPNFGDKWYVYYVRETRRYGAQVEKINSRKRFTVSLKAG
jgi:hypothetical protein